MTDVLTATDGAAIGPDGDAGDADTRTSAVAPTDAILRDIARGGIAGILVGIFVAGLGGRLVMRLATILHEDTVGRITENGERIGRISFEGTLALVLFGGLAMGLMAGVIWVIARPWIPGHGLGRALITGLLAVALGTPALIQRGNPDFSVLGFDPVVVVMLVGLVFAVGVSIALVDEWLDRHLPSARSAATDGTRGFVATTIYAIVALFGVVLVLPVIVTILLDQSDYRATVRAGWALLAVGICTLASWILRIRGRTSPPRALAVAGGLSLLAAAILGVITSLPHLRALMELA